LKIITLFEIITVSYIPRCIFPISIYISLHTFISTEDWRTSQEAKMRKF